MTFLIMIFDDPFVRSNGLSPIKTLASLKDEKGNKNRGIFCCPEKKESECNVGEKDRFNLILILFWSLGFLKL